MVISKNIFHFTNNSKCIITRLLNVGVGEKKMINMGIMLYYTA